MSSRKPDFESYTYEQLLDVRNAINRFKHPDRLAEVERLISERRPTPAEVKRQHAQAKKDKKAEKKKEKELMKPLRVAGFGFLILLTGNLWPTSSRQVPLFSDPFWRYLVGTILLVWGGKGVIRVYRSHKKPNVESVVDNAPENNQHE